ncbi:hypothetical protein [Sphingomonas sp.]|uniref:GAP1-N1 domain-containing protein n=1 Tax=Sphingomonas sp. TaxID=28214 RepID=UPI0028AEAF09|nr:hypothetical protein [Sphingomonas sp.]
MVARVIAARTEIIQTLHGYSEGHSLIAGSAELDHESASLMLIMSDLAPKESSSLDGWLTGYPLPGRRRYVISRTWPAPEMPRPGCVWTHSLIVDVQLLGSYESLATFLDMLRRPEGDFASYRRPLSAPPRARSAPLPSSLFSAARASLADLYGTTRQIEREIDTFENAQLLISALWEQQWPDLRARFRWTTLDARPSEDVGKFDFILRPSKNLAVPRRGKELPPEQRQAWVVAALADLRAGGGGVRSELKRLAADVRSGRRAFSLLVSTILLVGKTVLRSRDAHSLINMMARRLRTDEARLAKGTILAALLRDPDGLTGRNLEFALSLVPDLDEPEALAIARACWSVAQTDFWELATSSMGRVVLHRVLDELPAHELAKAAEHNASALHIMIEHRPDLMCEPSLWNSTETLREALMALVQQNPKLQTDALKGVFAAKNVQLAKKLAERYGTGPMFGAYIAWERGHGRPDALLSGFEREWLVAAAADAEATRAYLKGEFRLRPSVVALARLFGPSSFAPGPGENDIWAESWEHCAGRPVAQDREYIGAFFLYRACHYSAPGRAERFALAFGVLLDAFEDGLRDPGARGLVFENFTQYGVFTIFERDITKLYRGVARLVALNRVPISVFASTGRMRHFEGLVEQLQWQPGGGQAIRNCLQDADRRFIGEKRIKLLEQALR